MNCVAHFAHWSRRRRVTLQSLDQHIVVFVDEQLARCTCAAPVQRSRNQIRAALQHLFAVVSVSCVQQDHHAGGPVDKQFQRVDNHLLRAKGLAGSTGFRHTAIVRALLSMTSNAPIPSAGELRQFLAKELSRVSAASGGVTATAVRSYRRFRAFEGDRVEHLLPVVAAPAHWCLAPLPQTLAPSEVNRLLFAFPTDLPSRLRSYALVRCVVDLGRRSSEAIALELEDIDWVAAPSASARANRDETMCCHCPNSPALPLLTTCDRNAPCSMSASSPPRWCCASRSRPDGRSKYSEFRAALFTAKTLVFAAVIAWTNIRKQSCVWIGSRFTLKDRRRCAKRFAGTAFSTPA